MPGFFIRGFPMAANRILDIIAQDAQAVGLPSWIPTIIAQRESSLNPNEPGDFVNGRPTSFGLFQLHRGGLAPSSLSDAQLLDPNTNASIAVQAMKPAYDRGVQAGYSGLTLLEYTANTSGWPGSGGLGAYPDYNVGLARAYEAYQKDSGEAVDTIAAQSAGDHYANVTSSSPAASVFRSIYQKEHIQSYSEWKKGMSTLDKLNPLKTPFGYVFDQGASFGVRLLLVLIAIIIIALALAAIILPMRGKAEEVAAGGDVIV